MKVLLLGANSQIGQEIRELAYKFKVHMYACTRQQLDITQSSCVRRYFAAIKPHYVINTAAYTAVAKAEIEKEAAFSTNAIGARNLAEAAKQFDIPLLHISTDYVFDGRKKLAYVEEDLPNPLSVYGMSKLAGEFFIRQIWPKHIILRVSWVFGSYGNNFVKNILRLAQEKTELQVICDQIGSPSYAGDIAETVLNLVKLIQEGCQMWGTYHFTGSPVTTWYRFAQIIVKNAKKTYNLSTKEIIPIFSSEFPTEVTRPHNSQLNCTKVKKKFNITQKNWHIGLMKLIKELA
ncbi:MAG: dTDP-4-dehydrorhamnose reductase [Rickettsiella sp.]|nr:dTDP-4-dehydrorhamnose reductase [Rickettsiella sp.]